MYRNNTLNKDSRVTLDTKQKVFDAKSIGSTTPVQETFGLLLVIVLSSAVYWDTLNYDFVHDDIVTILRNPDVRPNTPWINLLRNDYWGTPMRSPISHKSYRPLTILTFRLNFCLDGVGSAFWFHLTNVLIHATVSALLFYICLHRLGMNFATTITTSLLFALHPIHTEAVAGITGRADSLACLLMLVSFVFYTRSLTPVHMDHKVEWNLFCAGIIGCFAMFAKETGLTILATNVLYDLYIHQPRIQSWLSGKMFVEDVEVRNLKRRISYTITLVVLCLLFRLAVMNGELPNFGAEDNPASHSTSFLTRGLTYGFLPVFNFYLIIYPQNLSYDWQMGSISLITSINDQRNIASLIFYLILAVMIIQITTQARTNSWRGCCTVFALCFASLTFLPASNLLFPVGFVAAERVLYAPSLGICILTGVGFQILNNILRRRRSWRYFLWTTLCLVLVSFSVKTVRRSTIWKSRASLLESGVHENPNNAKVHYNYGNYQKDHGNLGEAFQHYTTAISLWPDYASAWNNLGAVSNDSPSAEMSFLHALQSNPGHNGAHYNLGIIYLRMGRDMEALKHLEHVVFQKENVHPEAMSYLGLCYKRLNKSQDASTVFRALDRLDLAPAKLHSYFGTFLKELGRNSEALVHYLLALSKTSMIKLHELSEAVQLASQLGLRKLFQELSRQLLGIKFEPTVAYSLALSYVQDVNHHDAEYLFQKLTEMPNSFYRIHYAQFLIDIGQFPKAEHILRCILRTDLVDASSLLLLARALENQNRTSEAFDTLNSTISNFCPKSSNLCSIFYSQLGNIRHTQGELTAAAYYYTSALKFDSNSIQAHANIGAIYHLLKKYEDARRHYSHALVVDPSNVVVIQNMKKLEKAVLTSNL